MRVAALLFTIATLAVTECAEELPAHLSEFVVRLKEEIAATAEKFTEPRERATRILAAHVGLLSQLPISDRKLLAAFYDGNSLLEIVDPNNYRREAVHRPVSTRHP